MDKFIEMESKNNVKARVFKLADNIRKVGRTATNVREYNRLNRKIKEDAIGAAKKTSRKKFGYMQNPVLTRAGRTLRAYKMALDCVTRMAPPTPTLTQRADELGLDLDNMMSMERTDLLKEARERRAKLWEAKKLCEPDRLEWIRTEAKSRAKASGDEDWEKGVKNMLQTARSRAANRKLGAVLKERQSTLDRIQMPTHVWHYSRRAKEVYRYNQGNFEAYLEEDGDKANYLVNHVIKVLPKDAIPAKVVQNGNKGWTLVKTYKWYHSKASGCLYFKANGEVKTFYENNNGIFVKGEPSPPPGDANAVDVKVQHLDGAEAYAMTGHLAVP